MQQFRVGQRVVVNTGGADITGWVDQLDDYRRFHPRIRALLVRFENGTAQWLVPNDGRTAIRPLEESPDARA